MIITTSPSAPSSSSSLSNPSRHYQEQPNTAEARADMEGEAAEIAGLRINLTLITDTVTDVCTPQWFANRLMEKSFITHDSTKGILGTHGLTSADKTSQLMNSVFTKIRTTDKKRHWFDEFVAIFSKESACAELVERLKRCVSNTPTSPDHLVNQLPPYSH